jgi:hypothetical protein
LNAGTRSKNIWEVKYGEDRTCVSVVVTLAMTLIAAPFRFCCGVANEQLEFIATAQGTL